MKNNYKNVEVRCLFHHDFQDLDVGLLHAVATQTTDVVDGLFHVSANDTIATKEVVVLLAHLVAEDACFHRKGDFARARRLGAIADDASSDAQSIL